MKVSNLPTVKDFFEANRLVWKKYRIDLIFGFAATVGIWFSEGLFNLRILGGLPAHYVPELTTFFFFGCFAAEVKKTLIPIELIVGTTYLSSAFVGVFVLGISSFNLLFSLLFPSPFLCGFLVTRIRNWRQGRKR